MRGRYLMVLPVPAFPGPGGTFEIESAFAEHLRMLRSMLGPLARTLIIAAPELSAAERAVAGPLTRLDEARDGIGFRPMFRANLGRVGYLRELPRVLAALRVEVREADVVHGGNSPLYRPFEFPALMMASLLGKKTISVTDIDHRRTARMNLETGRWSAKEYWITRFLHDPFTHLQQTIGVRRFSLVLLKGRSLVDDYGRGRPNVRHFLDSAFGVEHIIPAHRLEEKVRETLSSQTEVKVVYFGRLVEYKGVDGMLRAVRHALNLGARLRFEIVGSGPADAALRALTRELGLESVVSFIGAVPFGPGLFDRLYDAHVLLAAPLSEDTPRSALDACAMGLAIVAYDTSYYRELAELGGPVEIVPWRDMNALGQRLLELDAQRARLADLLRKGAAFAAPNTQQAWLEKRVAWTRALFDAASPHD
jgi:glycosyltransferase involved in cell wall biosynthesis